MGVGQILRLWVDDKRPAPEGWLHVKTAADAIAVLSTQEVHELAPDHDLGHCDDCTDCKGYKSKCGCRCHWSGYSVALFMATTGRWPEKKPTCHSSNPAGRANIESTIERYFGKQVASSPGEYRLTWRELEIANRFTVGGHAIRDTLSSLGQLAVTRSGSGSDNTSAAALRWLGD